MEPELVQVVVRLRNAGGEAAARDLDGLLRPRLYRYFAAGPWPSDEAADLVQKTLARVYAHVGQLHDPECFVGWLFAIARNVRRTASAQWNSRRNVETAAVASFDAYADRGPNAERVVIDGERLHVVQRAIEALPARQRECLLLRTREDLSYEEIADLLRVSPLTVRNHLAQARETVRRAIFGAAEAVR